MLASKTLGSLSAASDPSWDVSKAQWLATGRNSFFLDKSGQGIYFKPDGTKMYFADTSFQSIREYNLSTPWDITTLSEVQQKSVSAQESQPFGLFFKPDGTKMYVLGAAGDDVNEYTLSTAWNVSTATYVQAFSIAAQELNPASLSFKPDGTKMYVLGASGNAVNEYTLSTAWDVSTSSYVQAFSVAAQDTNLKSLFFKPDGTKMYVLGWSGRDVNEYSLSTAWDVSTATYVQVFSVLAQTGNFPFAVHFKADGTVMYALGNKYLFQYPLSTAWDVSTATYTVAATKYFNVAPQDTSPFDVFFKPDGTKMYVLGGVGRDVNEYDLSTAWDISTASYVQVFSVSAQEVSVNGLFFKPDGTKMYVIGSNGDDVNEYTLSTAWDISTATYVQVFSIGAQETVPTGLFFKTDGTKMYVIGSTGDDVNEYNLSTAWNVSTASYVQVFSVAAQDTAPTGLFFKPDGTKMYVIGQAVDSVHEYNLSTAWDVSTASYVQVFSIAAQETAPQGLFFRDDGLRMYVIGSNSDAIWEYDLV